MKIYFATTAIGNEDIHERGMLDIYHRLLSYFLIKTESFECHKVFDVIRKENSK